MSSLNSRYKNNNIKIDFAGKDSKKSKKRDRTQKYFMRPILTATESAQVDISHRMNILRRIKKEGAEQVIKTCLKKDKVYISGFVGTPAEAVDEKINALRQQLYAL